MDYRGASYMVSSVNYPNGLGGTFTTSYTYQGARIHKQGKGFLGFSKLTATGPTSKTITDYGLNTSYFAPIITQSQTLSLQGTNLSKTVYNHYSYHDFGNHRYFTYPDNISKTDINNNITNIQNTINQSGDLTHQITDINTGESKTDATYSGYNAQGNPSGVSTIFSRTGKPNITQSASYTYYANGDLHTSLSDGVTTTYVYDDYGNTNSITISGSGIQSRTSTIGYDDTYHRFATSTTNALNQTASSTYDDMGNQLVQTDINGLSTTNTYDSWGRLLTTTTPDNRLISYSYGWANGGDAPENALYYTEIHKDNYFNNAEYFDILGRSLRKVTIGYDDMKFYTDNKYNTLGQVYENDGPYNPNLGTAHTVSSYSYYATNLKLHITTLPDLRTITNTYSDNTVTQTYSTGEVYSKTTDGAGNIIQATDPGGTITYSYNSINQPLTITAPGSTTSMTYDNYGHQLTLSDPDAGITNYAYNTFGETNSITDARQKTTTILYDKLGRISTKTVDGLVITYSYDGTHGKGKIQTITAPGKAGLTYTYDDHSRLSGETRSNGSQTFTYQYGYDSKGRINSLTYPAGLTLTYSYTNYDDLAAIYDQASPGTPVWSLSGVNTRGLVQYAAYGNGKLSTYDYDDYDHLTSISVPNIINFTYNFNTQNQLNYRTENHYASGWHGFTESFTYYSGVNRLHTATGGESLTMTYDGNRIDSKSNAGSYIYQSTGNHKLETLEATSNYNPPFQDLSFTASGKLESVMDHEGIPEKEYQFIYGADNQRFKVSYSENSTLSYNRYYFNNYEKETHPDGSLIRHLNYIYANGQLIGLYEQTPSYNKMHYIYTDYLGSLRCITSDNGTIEQFLSFDAWGNRRDPDDGHRLSETEITPLITLTPRGFTGHEHMDKVSLINMNGRVYDPALGLFLSPDNYVQAPDATQNFNRYCYCLNNPLMYTDPSGEIIFLPILYMASQAGFVNFVQQAYAGNVHNLKEGVTAYAVGFVGGVAGRLASNVTRNINGVIAGSAFGGVAGGVAGGLSGGLTSWAGGNSFKSGFKSGAFWGGLNGMVQGGIKGYSNAVKRGANPWTLKIEGASKTYSFSYSADPSKFKQPDASKNCYAWASAFSNPNDPNPQSYLRVMNNADGAAIYDVAKNYGAQNYGGQIFNRFDNYSALGQTFDNGYALFSTENSHVTVITSLTVNNRLNLFGTGTHEFLSNLFVMDPIQGAIVNGSSYVGSNSVITWIKW